jgi:hypothetical protein
MRKKFPLLLSALVLILPLNGCNQSVQEPSPTAKNSPSTAATAPITTAPAGGKNCFACDGSGDNACTNCVAGKLDCPGACLRLNRGNWVPLEVAGHPPTDRWQKFALGHAKYSAYNQNHVGHLIQVQGDKAVDIGACPVCHGLTKISCPACNATGHQMCLVCGGKKFVPSGWSATDNPWFNSQPDRLRLADGRILLGKVVSRVGDDLTVRTRTGKSLNVKASDILSRSGQ